MNTIKITDNKNLKTSEIFEMCTKKFDMYCYWDFKELDSNFPPPTKTTTRYFRKEVEPDKEFLGKSAQEADPDCKIGITLRERLLLEIAYFNKTGNHLDVKGATLCTGSRSSDGKVPRVYWYPSLSQIEVYWYLLSDSNSDSGLRSCVQLSENVIQSKNEENNNKDKEQFTIICERCGLSKSI